MAKSTIKGYWAQKPTAAATSSNTTMGFNASFDPTSSSQISLGTLPANARLLDVVSFGGSTGGTNPTVDVGTAADDDGLANELAADGFASGTGALSGNLLTVDTEIFGKVGASAATGGTVTVNVRFVMQDT